MYALYKHQQAGPAQESRGLTPRLLLSPTDTLSAQKRPASTRTLLLAMPIDGEDITLQKNTKHFYCFN
jgi:hypothetical protein